MRFVCVPVASEASLSPILVRPVREQLEHDRVIRLLQQDLSKRKVEVGINPGTEQNASVGAGSRKEYPDVVLYSIDKGRKVIGVLEVETGESVNHLEAMAQWAHLAKLKVPFHLYVPMGSVDVARRLSADYRIPVTEIWSYHQVGDQFRFTLIHPVGSRGGRGAPAPRTVSVASIRVAQLPDIEAPVEEAPPPPVTPAAPGRRVVAAKAKLQPPPQPAPVPAPKGAKGKSSPAGKAPAPVPSKPVPTPAKAAVAKATLAKSSSARTAAAKPARAAAVSSGRPVPKSPARPAAKPARQAVARASQPRAARPAARPSPKPARTQRPKAAAKTAPKAGRRK